MSFRQIFLLRLFYVYMEKSLCFCHKRDELQVAPYTSDDIYIYTYIKRIIPKSSFPLSRIFLLLSELLRLKHCCAELNQPTTRNPATDTTSVHYLRREQCTCSEHVRTLGSSLRISNCHVRRRSGRLTNIRRAESTSDSIAVRFLSPVIFLN